MADMVTAEGLRQRKRELPSATVVCYINSSAEVKAESDVCCTSANAVKVIESLDAEDILFVPDQYLGHYISTKTNKRLSLCPGFCPTHIRIQPQHITNLRQEHPQAKVVVHPECRPEVIALADEVLSTGGMCRFAHETEREEIIGGDRDRDNTPAEKGEPREKIHPCLRASNLSQNEVDHPGECLMVFTGDESRG